LEVTIIKEGKHRRKASITAEWELIRQEYDDTVADYARGSVPGFRTGKAPIALVESRYGKRILDQVAARSVERITRKALAMKEMTAAGPVSISEIVVIKNKPLCFTAVFTELPDFDLPDYTEYRLNSSSDEQRRDEISHWLLDNTAVSVPDELVTQELSLDAQKDVEPESVSWQEAFMRVRLLLILEKVAAQDGIEVDERDVQERIRRISEEFGEDEAKLRTRLLSNGGMSRIRNLLLAERTLDYLLEICS
jgi:FKBP-type peptidyl-prolyl cis-trans isomerase (trigger factor)